MAKMEYDFSCIYLSLSLASINYDQLSAETEGISLI